MNACVGRAFRCGRQGSVRRTLASGRGFVHNRFGRDSDIKLPVLGRMPMKLRALSVALMLLAGPAVAVADDLEDAVNGLKDAAAKSDVNAVKKLAATIR